MAFVSMFVFFFFKQKTAYELRISDWSSDVCSSDLMGALGLADAVRRRLQNRHEILEVQPDLPDCIGGPPANPAIYNRVFIPGKRGPLMFAYKIGRASCRESVCQYV